MQDSDIPVAHPRLRVVRHEEPPLKIYAPALTHDDDVAAAAKDNFRQGLVAGAVVGLIIGLLF